MLADQLIKAGFAVMALDAQYHGERMGDNDFESPFVFTIKKRWFSRTRDMNIQTSIEYRRAIDYLVTRTEIDISKIGMVGYSNGGLMTFYLSAIDSRIKTSVATVAPVLGKPHLAIAAHHYAPYITSQAFLMLTGDADQNYTKAEAQQLYDMIGSHSKDLVIYKSGHKLPKVWTQKATQWMTRYLGGAAP